MMTAGARWLVSGMMRAARSGSGSRMTAKMAGGDYTAAALARGETRNRDHQVEVSAKLVHLP